MGAESGIFRAVSWQRIYKSSETLACAGTVSRRYVCSKSSLRLVFPTGVPDHVDLTIELASLGASQSLFAFAAAFPTLLTFRFGSAAVHPRSWGRERWP